MNGITIGQYIPGNSWLHRLDPRNKNYFNYHLYGFDFYHS